MKAAIVVGRDDNYGENLHHRANLCLKNLVMVFDKVFYIDWKTIDNKTLPESIGLKHPKLEVISVSKELIERYYPELINYPIIEVIARNIGVRKAIENNYDWICSTNIDNLMTEFNERDLDINTFYTARKYRIPQEMHLSSDFKVSNISKIQSSLQRDPFTTDGVDWADDKWSLVVNCGDFQLAHKDTWIDIKGFEEAAWGRAGADTNIMKKAILCNKTTAVYEGVDVYHLNHTTNAYRDINEKSLPLNSKEQFITNFTNTTNTDNWGMKGLI